MMIEMWTAKFMLVRFQVGIKSIGNWAKDYSCYSLVKNMVTFSLCPENMGGNELKSNGLTYLAEGISR